jgi:hypothetical protein
VVYFIFSKWREIEVFIIRKAMTSQASRRLMLEDLKPRRRCSVTPNLDTVAAPLPYHMPMRII